MMDVGKAILTIVTLAVVAGSAALLYLVLEPTESAPPPQVPLLTRPAQRTAPVPSDQLEMEAPLIPPGQVKRWLDTGRGFAFIDVRTPQEFEKWRIPGAILVPLEPRKTFGQRLGRIAPDPRQDVVLFCRTGRRSDTAALLLQDLGYQKAYNMGGIIDWNYTTEGADE